MCTVSNSLGVRTSSSRGGASDSRRSFSSAAAMVTGGDAFTGFLSVRGAVVVGYTPGGIDPSLNIPAGVYATADRTLAFRTAPAAVFSAASVICLPEPRAAPLDGVGGWVFTRRIEHTFEHRVILMVQEVPL